MDYTAIGTFLLVLITFWMTRNVIKESERSSQASIDSQKEMTRLQLTMQLIEKYDSDHVRSKRHSLASNLIQGTSLNAGLVESVIDILETVGTLQRRGWLDADLAYSTFSVPAIFWWTALESYVKARRAEAHDKKIYDQFEHLANNYRLMEPAGSPGMTDAELKAHLQSELQ